MEFLAYIGTITVFTLIITLLAIIPVIYIKYKIRQGFRRTDKKPHKKKICRKCGAALASTAVSCPICGYRF